MSYESKLEVLYGDLEGLNQEAAKIYEANAPKFDRGIAEAAMERTSALLKDLKQVFDKHQIAVSFNAKMQSEQQIAQDGLPIVIFGGIVINIESRVFPLDGQGNASISDEAREQLLDVENRIRAKHNKIQALVKKMHGAK